MADTNREITKITEAEAEALLAAMPKAKGQPKAKRPCACGCGTQTGGRWAPGHDARLWGPAHKVALGRMTPAEAAEAIKGFSLTAGEKARANLEAGYHIAK